MARCACRGQGWSCALHGMVAVMYVFHWSALYIAGGGAIRIMAVRCCIVLMAGCHVSWAAEWRDAVFQ
eukprot:4463733-Prorocentrum_lima.AAC.1